MSESLKEKKRDDDPCWEGYEQIGMKTKGGKEVPNCVPMKEYIDRIIVEEYKAILEKKQGPCKPQKGKRFADRVDGECRSYGQAGKAKDGGDRIEPGTEKGDAYCARSAKIKKCKNPPCANDLSRKKWKCRGSKSMDERKYTMSEMKLIIEGWRDFVEKDDETKFEVGTIGDLLKMMKMAREQESDIAAKWLSTAGMWDIAKSLPGGVGTALSAGDTMYKAYKKAKRMPQDPDKVADFPVLAILNIDPNLIQTIEDDILNQMDEEYEEYLKGLKFETPIKSIIPINDFIRQRIKKSTEGHVTITDTSK